MREGVGIMVIEIGTCELICQLHTYYIGVGLSHWGSDECALLVLHGRHPLKIGRGVEYVTP